MPGKGTKQSCHPAHQNSFAFKHNVHSAKTQRIENIPNINVCTRCYAIIEWRKKYRKYKPIKDLRKCYACHQKAVRFAYHIYCDNCVKKTRKCAKCSSNIDEVEKGEQSLLMTNNTLSLEKIQFFLSQQLTRERVRRSVMRAYERGEATEHRVREIIALGCAHVDGQDSENEDHISNCSSGNENENCLQNPQNDEAD